MGRSYSTNGPTLVKVQNGTIGMGKELGITDKQGIVHIRPRFAHKDIHVDDYGDTIPPEVQWMLADCIITMTLIHFDQAVLNQVVSESMAGGTEGTMQGAGSLMGNNIAAGQAGNHFITLGLITQTVGGRIWRFPTAYLAEQPMDFPLGVKVSAVRLVWRAIPYKSVIASPGGVSEVTSAGAILWDHTQI